LITGPYTTVSKFKFGDKVTLLLDKDKTESKSEVIGYTNILKVIMEYIS
jgi:hypothetical protein